MGSRKLISLALTASCSALALCIASPSSAVSSIELVYLGGGTGNLCTNGPPAIPGHPGLGSGYCIAGRTGDTLRFAIAVKVDSSGMYGYSFDLRWDVDGANELDLLFHRERFSLDLVGAPGPPPTIVAFNLNQIDDTQESSFGTEGHLYGYEGSPFSLPNPFILPASVSFRVGYVEFRVTTGVELSPGFDIEVGFFRPAGGGFGDGNLDFVTPNFGSFVVDRSIVPEPGTIVLLTMGVLALAVARPHKPRS